MFRGFQGFATRARVLSQLWDFERNGVGLDIKILDTSHGPVYDQIRRQLAEAISSGSLASGTALPTPAALSQQVSVDKGEISRAYFELEQAGLIVVKKSKNFLGETMTTYSVR